MSSLVITILYVNDLARSEAFYRDMLGLQKVDRLSGGTFVFLKPEEGTPVALQPLAEMPAGMNGQPGATQLGFDVADLDTTLADWKEQGVEVVSEIIDMGAGRMFLAHDPDGNTISVSQLYDGVRALRKQLGL